MKDDLNKKILFGIERVFHIQKILYISLYKNIKLSPIQIQMIEFISNNRQTTVSSLAKEFSLEKSTISDSVKILIKKGVVVKNKNPIDSRSFFLELTQKGSFFLKEKQKSDSYLLEIINFFSEEEKVIIHKFFVSLIKFFYKKGIIQMVKICFFCNNFLENENGYFCNFLKQPLSFKNIEYNCNFFKNSNKS